MSNHSSNQPFALIRDELRGIDFWEVWDERMPFGTSDHKIVAVVHGFWFTTGPDGSWNGPFPSREAASVGVDDFIRVNAIKNPAMSPRLS